MNDPELPSLAEDLMYVKTVFDELAAAWVRSGRPMPPAVSRARGILDSALTCSMSLERQDIEPDAAESSSASIGSDEVAELLGVTPRTVQRRAESLGGKRISGAWVFEKSDIGGVDLDG